MQILNLRGNIMVLFAWVITGMMPACTTLQEAARETTLVLPADKPLIIRNSPVIELSPDGDYLVYPVDVEGGSTRMLYLKPLDGSGGRILPGTEEAEMPFFSPDGQWIAFFSGGELRKVALAGGDPVSLCEASAAQGGSWGSRDSIIFATDRLWEVSADGGLPRAVTQPGAGESHSWPRFLPDGDHVLFNRAHPTGDVPQVEILHIDSGRRTTLLKAGSFPSYAATGHLVYADAVSLHAAPLDLQRMQITGNDVIITEGVLLSTGTYVSHYAISRTGTLVYVPGRIFGENRRVVLLDKEGNERDAGLPPDRYSYIRFSPTGSRLALQVDDEAESSIWITGRDFEDLELVVKDASYPTWSADGTRITFASARDGVPGIYWSPVGGESGTSLLTRGVYPRDHSYDWSPDGRILAYTETHPETGMDLWLLEPGIPRTERPLVRSRGHECCPAFSPDGKWLAYVAGEPNSPEVYLQALAGPAGARSVSPAGGREPAWARDGLTLYYWQDRRLMALDPNLDGDKPRMLFEGLYVSSTSTWRTRYDVDPDDEGFVIIKRGPEESGISRLRLVSDFFERIRNRN